MEKSTIHCVTDDILSAHLDGDLAPARDDEVRRHLETCDACREACDDLRTLRDDLAAFGTTAPSPEVWSRIVQAGAVTSPRIGRVRRTAWVAAATAAAAAAAVLALILIPEAPDSTPKEAPARPDPIAALVDVQRAESAYREAIDALEGAVRTETPRFEPQTMAIVNQSLEEVEAAIDRSREAVRRDPGNVEAVRTLLAAYQEKVDLLSELLEQRI